MDDNTQESHITPALESTPQVQIVKQNSMAIPIAIVIGFGLIAGAIYFSGTGGKVMPAAPTPPGQETVQTNTGVMRPVDENDHILGNPNAPIMIVEYSDYDCPFCKNFHETMNQIMKNYGTDGKVAWVYRHFPLEQLHPSAPYIAQASECVAELGGNDAFWKFSDLVFGERGINERTNTTRLNEFAVSSGVSGNAFESCMTSAHTKQFVEEDFADGVSAGAKGTPHTLVLVAGQRIVISGAQPYASVSQLLDTIIKQIDGEGDPSN